MPNSWSYSSLTNFEKCPHSVTFPYRAVDNEFTARGSAIHAAIEAHLRAQTSECPCPNLQEHFNYLQRDGLELIPEAQWGLDIDWEPVEYKGSWLKIKPDLVVIEGNKLKVIDFKTGKRYGNELKHGSQVQLYLCAAAQYYKGIELFNSELWYVDHGLVIASQFYTRDRIDQMRERWHKRGVTMTRAADLPPRPSKSNCKYCFERDRCEFAFEL